MQLRIDFRQRNCAAGLTDCVLLEEEGSRVDEVGGVCAVNLAVVVIAARGRSDLDVGSAVGTALRVVHGGPDTDFFNHLRRRRGQAIAVGSGDSRVRLRLPTQTGSLTNIERVSLRGVLAGSLAVEKIRYIDAVDLERIACVALSIGPERLIAQTGIGANAGQQFRVHARETELPTA